MKYNSEPKKTILKIKGKKRLCLVHIDEFGKKRIKILDGKVDRIIVNKPGDAILSQDAFNQFSEHFDFFMNDGDSDPEYNAWRLLQKDHESLRNFQGFKGVHIPPKSKYNHTIRFNGRIVRYAQSKEKASEFIDYLTDLGKSKRFDGGKFQMEKVS